MLNALPFEKTRKALQWAVIAAFLGLLWLPTLDSFLHLDKSPTANENRAPAPFPVFNQRLDGIRTYVAGLESYYNDHFGFRNKLIRMRNHWKSSFLKDSALPNVVTGRDGWFYFSGDNMIENFFARIPIPPQELRAWQSLLETRRDWLAKRGIRYIFVIPPNKESIYSEFLPDWLAHTRPSIKLDQLLAYMKTNSTVEIVDLRPPLLEAKRTNRVYMKTDTHWNLDGAFVAHQELIRALSRQWPGLEPLSLASFKRTYAQRTGGDLTQMLGLEKNVSEPDDPSFSPLPPLRPLQFNKVPNLLPGKKWSADVPLVTENTNRAGEAILFGDSFSTFWYPFLGYYFGKVTYLSENTWEPAFIEREKPVVVIDEMIERWVYVNNPAQIKTTDGLK